MQAHEDDAMTGNHHATPRRRRVSAQERDRLKDELELAAFSLFLAGGPNAISMRAVAREVGVSAMTPYGYFASKADLLASLWPHILGNLYAKLAPLFDSDADGTEKQAAICRVVLEYWESNPEHYRVVYMTEGVAASAPLAQREKVPSYKASLAANLANTEAYAREIGGDPSRAAMANDLRFAMLLGFAHATVVTRHYPWTDRNTLKLQYIDQVVRSVRAFLLQPADALIPGNREEIDRREK